MTCPKCANEITNNSKFCPKCGTILSTNTKNNKQLDLTKKQKGIILGLLTIIIIIFGLLIFLPDANGTRTIMIYVTGSNLESESAMATVELNSIDPEQIDLKSTNVIIYTGGSKKWHNFVSSDDNGIYILKKDGFEKIKSEEQYSMGDPSTLANFLKYSYDNYKTAKYDLILFDHGAAIGGAMLDELTNDLLSLEEMKEAMDKSPFNEKNKLETIIFSTCLNGSIELANTFAPYAEYLVASEEVSYGSQYASEFNFINGLEKNDNGKTVGIKFVKAYEQKMEKMLIYNDLTYTYSVMDLSKINRVNSYLDEYIKNIDIAKNYRDISKIRANTYQYGIDEPSFDMIDLYEFVNNTKEYANVDNSKLISAINELVVYNNTNNDSSHGISVYFPYSGRRGAKYQYLTVYEKLNYSQEYRNFINEFNTLRSSANNYTINVKSNQAKKDDTTKSISLQLTQEQVDNYAYSTFAIFEQDPEHPDYYWILLNSDDVTLSSDGLLTANYENKFIKIYDQEDDKEYYLSVTHRQKYGKKTRGILYDRKETSETIVENESNPIVDLYIVNDKKGNPIITNGKIISNNDYLNGTLTKTDEYETYYILRSQRKILDSDGNVLNESEWESPPTLHFLVGKTEELKTGLNYTGLEKGNNYYALFFVTDINNEVSYSKLIKVGE